MFFEIYWTFSFSLTLSHTQKNVDGYFLAFDLDPDPIPTKTLGSATLFIKFKIFFFHLRSQHAFVWYLFDLYSAQEKTDYQ